MLTYRALTTTLRDQGFGPHSRLLALVDVPALGPLSGGTEAVLGALLASCETLLMPAFTTRCMVVPADGPPGNGLVYGDNGRNLTADFFTSDLPADADLGPVAEALRQHPESARSIHPLYSFAGVGCQDGLATQTLDDPLSPLAWLADNDGDVLLLGAGARANVALHLAERLAGRKQFVRWALTPQGVVECPACPGCREGFPAVGQRLRGIARRAPLGEAALTWIPLRDLVHITVGWIREDPRALLCDRPDCPACRDVRAAVRAP